MAKALIDADTLRRLVDEGVSQADVARHFGVSESAVCQRLKKLKMLTSRVAALEKAGEVVEEKLSAAQRLEKVQDIIDRELAWAVGKANQPGADRAALAEVILRFAGEVRQQLTLQLNITRTLIDLRVVKEFHDTVVEVIREESPETARRITERLKKRRALRESAELPGLTPPDRGVIHASLE